MDKELFQGLTNPVRYINDKTSFALIAQHALGLAIPPIIPIKTRPVVKGITTGQEDDKLYADKEIYFGNIYFQCQTTLEAAGKKMLLPFDPVISVNGKNQITRRYIAKGQMRGSIKEWWSMDDWEITLSGVLIGETAEECCDYQSQLRQLVEHHGSVAIVNEILNTVYYIRHIAVESYDFPFTKGMENQTFTLKAYSDNSDNMIEEIN